MIIRAGDEGTDTVVVVLDGIALRGVVAADDTEGWVEVERRDARGHLVVEGDHIATERRQGVVYFNWPMDPSLVRRVRPE